MTSVQLVALAEEIAARARLRAGGLRFELGGAGGISTRTARRFDAVLTDEAMPDLIGTELAREILRIRPQIPIILMSGYGGAQLTNRAAEIRRDRGFAQTAAPPRACGVARAGAAIGSLRPEGIAAMLETIPPHILVVDDDPQIRALLEEYLAASGLRVSASAASGEQMSQILTDEAIDLVVLDLRLAGEDGMAIARSLRDQSAIPIVMLTGVRDEADRVMGLRTRGR